MSITVLTPTQTPTQLWDKTGITYSNAAPGATLTYEFNYLGKESIKEIKVSCSCTKQEKAAEKKVILTMTLPKDYTNSESAFANVQKTAEVIFMNGTSTVLTLGATVNKLFKVVS